MSQPDLVVDQVVPAHVLSQYRPLCHPLLLKMALLLLMIKCQHEHRL